MKATQAVIHSPVGEPNVSTHLTVSSVHHAVTNGEQLALSHSTIHQATNQIPSQSVLIKQRSSPTLLLSNKQLSTLINSQQPIFVNENNQALTENPDTVRVINQAAVSTDQQIVLESLTEPDPGCQTLNEIVDVRKNLLR